LEKADANYPDAAANLSQVLLGPVAPELKNKRLLIVSDGVLQFIPFAGLPDPNATNTLVDCRSRDRDRTFGIGRRGVKTRNE